MKIVINKSTKVAAFIFEDTASIVLTETQMEAPDIIALDTGYNTHEVVNGDAPTEPLYWVSYALSYIDNAWAIADQEQYDALVESAKAAHAKDVANQRAKAIVVCQRQRAAEYPSITDYVDGIVKGDTAQVQTYIDACLAVKAKYPKPT